MSASIINTGGNTKIFSTNNVNKIEVSTENIIQSDSDSREVVKKGYLLSQINLTTIPDIIQNAINEAMLDTKEQTLADALIETLRLSISNLDDGVYKKTYIDNTISYIENLVISKVSPETVAAIADSKLAIALEGFATTSSVSTLSSRVGNSEIEISNVKQTINTKDTARALQIEQMEARVNDTFAGYSDAIDLYVDAQGNVKSQKIETLTTNIGLQLKEINQLIVATDNNWNAKSVKLITAPSGAITGYSFQDGSGLKSNFDINADNFKISNSYNTYSPFSIVGTSLYFNGKVTFSNVMGTDNLAYKDMSNVTTIDGGKITTNQAFVDNLNATGGVIAETVTANEFVGKTFTGSIINGAVINGAVVKASYLDLDGELEVLTNYHITPTMYAANPSLYTDAVYMSGTNEYRIPSISAIFEQNIISSGTLVREITGIIRSYNCANVGNNNKCVKIRPTISVSSPIAIANGITAQTVFNNFNGTNYPLSGNNVFVTQGTGLCVEIWFGNTLLIRIGSYCAYWSAHRGYIYDALTNTYVDTGLAHVYNNPGTRSLTMDTSSFSITGNFSATGVDSASIGLEVVINPSSFTLPFDFSDISSGFKIINKVGLDNGNITLKINSSIHINNML